MRRFILTLLALLSVIPSIYAQAEPPVGLKPYRTYGDLRQWHRSTFSAMIKAGYRDGRALKANKSRIAMLQKLVDEGKLIKIQSSFAHDVWMGYYLRGATNIVFSTDNDGHPKATWTGNWKYEKTAVPAGETFYCLPYKVCEEDYVWVDGKTDTGQPTYTTVERSGYWGVAYDPCGNAIVQLVMHQNQNFHLVINNETILHLPKPVFYVEGDEEQGVAAAIVVPAGRHAVGGNEAITVKASTDVRVMVTFLQGDKAVTCFLTNGFCPGGPPILPPPPPPPGMTSPPNNDENFPRVSFAVIISKSSLIAGILSTQYYASALSLGIRS